MARTPPTSADRLRLLSARLLEAADRFEVPSETTTQAERLIAHVEELADDVRAVVRGPSRLTNPPIGRVGGALVW